MRKPHVNSNSCITWQNKSNIDLIGTRVDSADERKIRFCCMGPPRGSYDLSFSNSRQFVASLSA